jgi:hypothetical protein
MDEADYTLALALLRRGHLDLTCAVLLTTRIAIYEDTRRGGLGPMGSELRGLIRFLEDVLAR